MKLPSYKIEILSGNCEAGEILKNLHASYWLAGTDDETALFLYQLAHESLDKLAGQMGYTLTPIAPPAEQEADE